MLWCVHFVFSLSRKGITAIFNLTEPGEHPHCGDGLEASSGFPYLPETFMREGSKCSGDAPYFHPADVSST